jgi:hypothetical protein
MTDITQVGDFKLEWPPPAEVEMRGGGFWAFQHGKGGVMVLQLPKIWLAQWVDLNPHLDRNDNLFRMRANATSGDHTILASGPTLEELIDALHDLVNEGML